MKEKNPTEATPPRSPSEKDISGKEVKPSKPERAIYILIGLTVLAHILFFMPFHGLTPDIPEVGDISTEEVIAPFTFEIVKSDEELAQERATVSFNVPVVLDFSVEISDSILGKFDSLWESSLQFIEKKSMRGRADSIRFYFPWITEDEAKTLSEFRIVSNVRQNVRELLTEIYASGVFDWESMPEGDTAHLFNIRRNNEEDIIPAERITTLSEAERKLKERSTERFGDYPEKGDIVYSIAIGLLKANLIPDLELTFENREKAVANIEPVRGLVLEDQRIVDAHEKITEDIHQKLKSLAIAKSGRYSTTPSVFSAFQVVGRLILTLLILVIFSFLIKQYYNDIWIDPAKFAMVMFAIWLPGMFAFVFRLAGWPELLTPMAFSASLLAILFGTHLGIIAVIAATMLMTFSGDISVSVFTVMLIEGIVASEVFSSVAKRRQSIKPIFYTVAAGVIAVTILDFVSFGEFGKMGLKALSVSAGSAFGPLLAIALIPVFERIVGIITDFTLLEYANTNAPVLQQLAIEAPGTYHHSMVVGNLAERAAEAIEANPLLAKVGGLYHDIGKLTHPEYFSENLSDHNPHDKLSPHMSFLVLSAHVKEGGRLARIHSIPKAIVDIIQEHHGNSSMKYFYEQAKSNDPSVTEDAFRYQGPVPQTREAALVMLADSVEAKIRSMEKVDSNTLKRTIKDTIDEKFEMGQLAETNLTTRDLNLIANSFQTIMEGVLHRRPSLDIGEGRSAYPNNTE